MILDFEVKNQIISRKDKNRVVADSQNYLYAHFSFSEDWNGTVKTAVFKSEEHGTYNVILEDDKCLVPAEVLKSGCTMFISVFGGSLITANKCYINVEESGLENGQTPQPPTPDVYETVLDALQKAECKVTDVKVNGGSVVNDKVAEITVPTKSTDLSDSENLIRENSYAQYDKAGIIIPSYGLSIEDKTGKLSANVAELNSLDTRLYLTHDMQGLYNIGLRNIPETSRVLAAEQAIIANEEQIDKLKEAVAQLHSFTAKVVDALPDTGENGILYLVAKDTKGSGNIYNEYLWIDSAYELIGDTAVDLSDYVTSEKLTQSLATKQDTLSAEQLENIAAVPDKADKAVIPTTTSQLTNDSNYVSDSNYVHTDNNFTTAERDKLKGLSNYDDSGLQSQIDELKIFERLTTNLYVVNSSKGGHLYYNPVAVRVYVPNGDNANLYVDAPAGSFTWVNVAESGSISTKIIAANAAYYITTSAKTKKSSIKYFSFITIDDVTENSSINTYSGKKIDKLIANLQSQIDALKNPTTSDEASNDYAVSDLMTDGTRPVIDEQSDEITNVE